MFSLQHNARRTLSPTAVWPSLSETSRLPADPDPALPRGPNETGKHLGGNARTPPLDRPTVEHTEQREEINETTHLRPQKGKGKHVCIARIERPLLKRKENVILRTEKKQERDGYKERPHWLRLRRD